jgi:hypothetical protein
VTLCLAHFQQLVVQVRVVLARFERRLEAPLCIWQAPEIHMALSCTYAQRLQNLRVAVPIKDVHDLLSEFAREMVYERSMRFPRQNTNKGNFGCF